MIKLISEPISPESIVSSLYRDDCGALVNFVGTVLNTSKEGEKVSFLEIEPCGSDAEAKLHDIASEVKQKWQIQNVAICRRIGKLKVGEIALVVVVVAMRRKEAFEACQYIIDRIKLGGVTKERDIYESA